MRPERLLYILIEITFQSKNVNKDTLRKESINKKKKELMNI